MRILYIAGAGRSGSTVLDEILGEGQGCFSLGEARQIWKTLVKKRALCSCGHNYQKCPFWREVLGQIFGKIGPSEIELEKILRAQKIVENIPLLSSRRREKYFRVFAAELLFYRELLRKLFQAIKKVSGARLLIDSTKHPHYLYLFAQMPDIKVYLLHLIRDSRAVAFSWQRRKYNPALGDYMKRHHPYTSTRLWIRFHLGIEILRRRFTFPYFRLRYEDLVKDPNKELDKMEKAFSLEGIFPRLSEGAILLGEKHLLGGNPVGFASREIRLRPDREWQRNMKLRDKGLVTFLTWPLLKYYGYPLRGMER